MYRVVIVDDEVLIRMYIREILESNGYEVVGEAEDGLEAICTCREQKPDFVIMDISMPILNGLEAAKVINEEKNKLDVAKDMLAKLEHRLAELQK